ncbi:ATP-dependent DNA helicase Q-like 2 [Ricinus communis]|uniref:ATP-dependent DNA helicase n=1 Tax=Ricinus communis TaxID=3988 RepID=B9S1J8_RICCO|nr:ATP-dependent DNA helicase Q-like 2 [Ricinus communis]EEF42467.1 DNA helicase recq1, putative [Ricinus communis]|eukprot:XP_002519863.1 mediator of RNA polymerase II transcription subunit 34 [Ricinus communis]
MEETQTEEEILLLQELENVEAEIQDVQEEIQVLLERQEKLNERKSELKAILETCSSSTRRGAPSSPTTASDINWSGPFEWDAQADRDKFHVFGITSYRPNQREIVNAVMSGRDVLVIMAAGGGKSLCYQLPAILRDGVSLVISPLISLIQDQVMGLKALGIPAYKLTSTTSKEDEKFIYKALEKGEEMLKILYVTPEKVSKSKRFMSKLEKCHHRGHLSIIAIDEAHCCSQWGHDFRPDYKNLGILKIQFPNVPVLALTATATQKVQYDLMEMLHIPKCVRFVSTVNRPNLFYMVREKSSVGKVVIDEIAEFIRESYPNNESGIVYCFSRKECEQVAADLRERGISADYYHADMDVNAREKVHMRWSQNKLQVIVGTVAFGMGINKPDVRFVIHHSLSKSMETYYQESGRAGRDGAPSECVLFFRPGDVPRQSSMVFYENSGLQNLYDIVRYCQSKRTCRRSAFFRHFSEPLQDCNGMCDNCAFSNEVMEVDVTSHAKTMVSLLQDMHDNDQRLTMLQLVDKVKNKHKELGADLKREEIEQLVIQLILDNVFKEEFQHTAYATNAYVKTGPLAKQVLQGRKIVKLEISNKQNKDGKMNKAKRSLMLSGLEFKLDKLRKELSAEHEGILPHSVLSSQQMSMISAQKPNSTEELEKIIGKLKTERYGNRILEEIKKFAGSNESDNGILNDEGSKRRPSKRLKTKKDLVLIESSDDE